MEMLKVGDRVCYEKCLGECMGYDFAVVKNVVKNVVLLSNGIELINEPLPKLFDPKHFEFMERGTTFHHWQRETPELLEKYKKSLCEKKALDWFNGKKFTKEEKIAIYEMFNREDSGYSIQFDENGAMYANLKNNQ
jgi:hypothetical protein